MRDSVSSDDGDRMHEEVKVDTDDPLYQTTK
jgi:hypothetical protein